MKKIFIINYEFPPLGGGAGTASYYTAKAFFKKGYDVTVITSHFKGLSFFETKDGIKIHRVPTLRRKKGTSNSFEMAIFVISTILCMKNIFAKCKPDKTIAFLSIPSGMVSIYIKLKYGVPYVVSLRGGDVPYFVPGKLKFVHFFILPLTKYVWRHAKSVSANSENLKSLANKISPEIDIKIIPNGIDSDIYFPRDDKNSKNNGVVALFVGRLNAQKGLDILLKALDSIKTSLPDNFRIIFVGDGPEEGKLKNIATKLNIDKFIEFTGWVDREELPDVYRKANIFILPSRYEGMPNALAEAIATGLPVITTDIPGCTTLVKDGENGFIIPFDKNGDPELNKLINCIISLINDYGLRQRMGLRSREIAKQFTWDITAERFIKSFS